MRWPWVHLQREKGQVAAWERSSSLFLVTASVPGTPSWYSTYCRHGRQKCGQESAHVSMWSRSSYEGDPSLRPGGSTGEEEDWEVGTTKRVLGHPPRGNGVPDSGPDCAVEPWGKCPERSGSALLLRTWHLASCLFALGFLMSDMRNH